MRHLHFVGIGGAGLSAMATLHLQQGDLVSGSDKHSSRQLDRLAELGATITIGHRPENISLPDAVIYSSAISGDNPEIQRALALQIPCFKRPAWLGQMMHHKRGICIAGTHGKTSTTALTAWLFTQAGYSPSFIIGGSILQLQTNAQAGKSDWFIMEADEYDRTFLALNPEIAIITHLDWDHPDIFPTRESYERAFLDFAKLVPKHGLLLTCGDDVHADFSTCDATRLTYGFHASHDWHALHITRNDIGGHTFQIHHRSTLQPTFSIRLPGLHQVKNTLAVIAIGIHLGFHPKQIAEIIAEFRGVDRRCEFKGLARGVTILDDYGHHPTEIAQTLAGLRTEYASSRIWAVMQPHTFSRTKTLLNEFATAFHSADKVILLDIYASREVDDGSIHSRDLLKLLDHPAKHYTGTIQASVEYLAEHVQPGDLVITFSAGDGNLVGTQLLATLQE